MKTKGPLVLMNYNVKAAYINALQTNAPRKITALSPRKINRFKVCETNCHVTFAGYFTNLKRFRDHTWSKYVTNKCDPS